MNLIKIWQLVPCYLHKSFPSFISVIWALFFVGLYFHWIFEIVICSCFVLFDLFTTWFVWHLCCPRNGLLDIFQFSQRFISLASRQDVKSFLVNGEQLIYCANEILTDKLVELFLALMRKFFYHSNGCSKAWPTLNDMNTPGHLMTRFVPQSLVECISEIQTLLQWGNILIWTVFRVMLTENIRGCNLAIFTKCFDAKRQLDC